ncbi:PH domain-containing protein [Arcanobacterium buesumense]|uniref:PH domain-containing protein n=1 Tax=Arcanobacterium buesumense TaxID=2722751 RepID=A0A6H2EMQ6_9ACTO|nr:PH domain-containing protein [Arcanobacterium buesumense]QJC22354.1 PH domain-containing protein [Arcanobacterium buesumense]
MNVTLRGENSHFWAYLLWILSLVILGASAWNGGWRELLFALPVAMFLSFVGWVGWWNPRLIVRPQGLHVINLAREYYIPWSDVVEVMNRWGLYIHTRSGKKIPVWVLPSRVGLLYNSWREPKRSLPHPIDWTAAEPQELIVPLPFVADSLMARTHAIRSDSSLRRRLALEGDTWETTTVRFLPLSILGTLILFICAVATFIF